MKKLAQKCYIMFMWTLQFASVFTDNKSVAPTLIILIQCTEYNIIFYTFVTLDHKTSHLGHFFFNWDLYIIWKLNK